MKGSRHIGYFEDTRDLLDAAKECRKRSIPIFDVISPFPVHGLDEVLGIRPSRLPWITLVAGIVGVACGFYLEYWTAAVSWPLNIGGKPLDSLPAFIPVAFEMTILFAGLATAGALFWRAKIWPGRRVPKGYGSTSDDRHALVLSQCDAAFPVEVFEEVLLRHGAVDLRHETEDLS